MSATTREQFIAAAGHLFAERGFYGASIAAIAEELGLTKQALLHHFGSKEKLYAQVLQQLSGQVQETTQQIMDTQTDPATQLEELVVAHYRGQMNNQDSSRLIMRELLDNEQRAAKAGNWYLKPYLETLVDTVVSIAPSGNVERAHALALIYQLLGAAHYFAVSQPTLASIFGSAVLEDTIDCYEQELRYLIRARLEALDVSRGNTSI